MWFVWGYTIVSSCFLRLYFFFNNFLSLFLYSNLFSFYLVSFFLESKPKAFQRISFCHAKKKAWMIRIHNSMVCLRVHYCVQLLPDVMCFFNNVLSLFLYSNLFSFYLVSFFLESKPKAFQRISFCHAKKKHEWSGYTIVWFVWGYTIVSSCFLRLFFFQPFPFPFPLITKVFFFYFLNWSF